MHSSPHFFIISNYDGVIVRSSTKITKKIIEKSKRLKVIARAGVGIDNVDVKSATSKGVIVMNSPQSTSRTTAEHTISLIFSLARKIPFAHFSTISKKWEKEQLKKLVEKQQIKISEIKAELEKEARIIAESELYSQKNPKSLVTLIAAASENNVIGKDNKLIWHLSDDLKHFKDLTKGHFVIMGRKTFESMPKALPNRTNVVITRKLDYKAENAIVVNSLEQALLEAKSDKQPFIIGGGEIYKLAIENADRIELTRVHTTIEGDAFFPEINTDLWQEVSSEKRFKDDKNEYDFTFYRYNKIK